jgi:hypothetical protein
MHITEWLNWILSLFENKMESFEKNFKCRRKCQHTNDEEQDTE